MPLRSGFVSILGLPNAGKSTLVNALVGEKVAIVTRKPQTTRNRILGVLEVDAMKGKHPAAQIVFIDTPGVHQPKTLLDKRMLREVHDALESRDIVLHVVDATRKTSSSNTGEDSLIHKLIANLDCPVFLVLNKIDAVADKQTLLPMIALRSAQRNYAEVIPISARSGDGLGRLVTKLVDALPEGHRYFQKGQFTDQPERFLAAEIIREKILNLTGEEVPYASAVVIEKFEERSVSAAHPGKQKPKPLIRIAAAIFCERPGQKAILIGKGGAMLKQIGIAARKDLESFLSTQVHLEMFVKVADEWRGSKTFLDSLDWRNQLENLSRRQSEEKKKR